MVNQLKRARTRRSSRRYTSKERRREGSAAELSYWEATRSPYASLMLVFPLLIVYEVGCVALGSAEHPSLRTGADIWLRGLLSYFGFDSAWLLPSSVVCILIGWQILAGRRRRSEPTILLAMILESVVLAVALVGASRLVDLAGNYLESSSTRLLAVDNSVDPRVTAATTFLGFLGAGVYEEFLFRLLLVPSLFQGLRLVRMPYFVASAVAVATSGLFFSLAHHAGIPGEPFTWFAFVFRWFAGLAFAWIFVIRGFGIAVGTHTTYDVLVGWLGWHF